MALEKNWQTTFTFKIEGVQHGGADGFAFVIQGAPYDTTISGDRDDGLGYANLKNVSARLLWCWCCGVSSRLVWFCQVVAFEFDMYQNSAIGDPNDHHVSLHYPSSKGGRVSASELANMDPGNVPRYHTLTANLKDGNVYTATITYTATSKQLQVCCAAVSCLCKLLIVAPHSSSSSLWLEVPLALRRKVSRGRFPPLLAL